MSGAPASQAKPARLSCGAHMALMFISSSFGTRYFSSVSKHSTLTYRVIYAKGRFQSVSLTLRLPATETEIKGRLSPPPGRSCSAAASGSQRIQFFSRFRGRKHSRPFQMRGQEILGVFLTSAKPSACKLHFPISER